jgi:hypothetical protein
MLSHVVVQVVLLEDEVLQAAVAILQEHVVMVS